MKYFSMFSGIGGFELGIGDRGECIGYSEIDKYAIEVYEKHFNHKNYGDATEINTEKLPDFSLLVGGFPCQAFSIAGKRGGFEDTRGTLFFEIARVLSDKRPGYFLLENVKGLLSHDDGKTFQRIVRVLTDIGYRVEWQVLNSKNFGVPQNRERVFIVGYSRGERRPEVFPIRRKSSQTIATGEVVGTLQAGYAKGDRTGGYVIKEKAVALTETRTEEAKKARTDGFKIRKLTPVECERLQGFPDNWTEGLSDTQRYKTLGNAVTVNVIEAIFNRW